MARWESPLRRDLELSAFQKTLVGIAAASAAALVQLAFWDFLRPLIWVLFYPAAFIAASFGGRVAGLASGIASILFVALVFVEPAFAWSPAKFGPLHTALIFLPMIYLIGDLQERYRTARKALASALETSERERKRIGDFYERSLQVADFQFTTLADALPQIVWATDAAGKNIYFNEAWMRYTGMTLAESLGDGWNTPFHPDDKQRAWEAWQNATRHLAEYSLEVRLRGADGSYRWWLIRGIPFKNATGEIVKWFGTCTDIHDIKQALGELAEGKSRLQTVFDNNPDGLAIISADGQMSFFNAKFAAYFGYDRPADLPPSYRALFSTLEVSTVQGQPLGIEQAPLARALAGETVNSQEIRFRDKATGRTWFGSHSAMPIRDATQTVTGVVVSVRDVSARLEDEVRLRNLVNEQSLILDSGVVGIAKLRDRKFIWVNQAFADNFGYAIDEIIGQSSRLLYGDTSGFSSFGEKVGRADFGHHHQLRDVLSLRRKDGSQGWFLVGGGPVSAGSQDFIWISVDVTEERKNRELLQASLARIERSMRDTLLVLSKTVEMHDPYTAGHQLRVGHLAREIGTLMGLPEDRTEGLELMGLIHDIGKIGIPAEILSKPGRLSEEELQLVRAHARIGHEILQHVHFDIPVAEVARQHHERIDGTGYPQGLRGEEILLEARIIAVADVVEAISSHRPYRPGLGLERALAEIEQGRGMRYDPQVVDACLRLFREKGYRLDNVQSW